MQRDQKVLTLLPQRISALRTSIKALFLLPKLDNSSPSNSRFVTLSKSRHYKVMMSLPPETEYPTETFE